MSKEAFHKFIRAAAQDKSIMAKLEALGGNMETIVAYGRELGYDFTQEDVRGYFGEVAGVFKSKMHKTLEQPQAALEHPGVKQLSELMNLAEIDETVAARLAKISSGSREDLIAYGREKGFVFNEEDIAAFAKEIMEPSDELSDEELEVAAGGMVVAAAVVGGLIAVGLGLVGGAGAAVVTSILVKK